MSELPTGWTSVSLHELADLNPKHPGDIDEGLEVSFVPMAAVSDRTGTLEEHESRLYRDVKKGYTHFRDGDVIFAKITPCMENGKAAVARGLKNGLACGSTEFFVLRSRGGLLPSLLHHYLRQESFRREARAAMTGAVGQARVPKVFMETVMLPVPPLSEQKRIADKLDVLLARLDVCRDRLERLPAILKRSRQSLLLAAVSGELTKEWREENVVTSSVSSDLAMLKGLHQARRRKETPEALILSEQSQLPETWAWSVAEDIVEPGADIVYGIVQPGSKLAVGVPYVRGTDIQDGKILIDQLLRTSPEIASKYARSSLKGGDVLLGIIRATKVAIVPNELDGANITQGTARFRPSQLVRTEYLAIALEAPNSQDWLHAHYRGIDMPGLNLQDVRRLPLPIPPLAEQEEIAKRLERAFYSLQQIEALAEQALNKTETLRASLLQAAFTGKLVPQDPNDEPASVLLDRIRIEQSVHAGLSKKRGRSPRAVVTT